jgi:pimeloyl-ACP methyl ester carboxylesterase
MPQTGRVLALHAPCSRTTRRVSILALLLLVLLALAGPALAAQQEPPAAGAVQKAPPAPAEAAADPEVGRLIEQVQQLLPQIAEQRRRILSEHADLFALGMLKLEKADLALGSRPPNALDRRAAIESLTEAATIWEALLKGQVPSLPDHGRIERAYVALDDMSPQPYILYVPDSYDGTRPYGLLAFLHGWDPFLNKLNWGELMYSEAIEPLGREADCIVLLPYGRSNTDFQGVGEDDVLRAIKETEKHYRIDEDRVFLSGISMGGMGVWSIGAHYPDMFAALIAIASRGDYYLWKEIQAADLPGFETALIDSQFGAELMPNYRNLPCVIVHGLADTVMPMEQSQRMHDLLKAQGFEVTFAKVPEATHYRWDMLFAAPEVLKCLREARRRTSPRAVTFRTYTLQYSRAYWAEVTGIEVWGRPADLACRLDESGSALTVETTNVLALRVRLPADLTRGAGPLQVTWNGKAVTPKAAEDGWLELGSVQPAAGGGLPKTRALCGPVRQAFSGPFIMVYGGTREGESFRHLMAGAADWVRFAQGVPNILSADAVTPEIMARFNLILYGTPEDNSVIAQVAPKLPIGLDAGRYRIGGRTYDASKYGLSMVYPNPLAPGHLVVVNSGYVWGRELATNHRYDMLPDFIVFTDEVSGDGTDSNKFAAAGFFDQNWRLSDQSTWYAPEPPAGEPAPPAAEQ